MGGSLASLLGKKLASLPMGLVPLNERRPIRSLVSLVHKGWEAKLLTLILLYNRLWGGKPSLSFIEVAELVAWPSVLF